MNILIKALDGDFMNRLNVSEKKFVDEYEYRNLKLRYKYNGTFLYIFLQSCFLHLWIVYKKIKSLI